MKINLRKAAAITQILNIEVSTLKSEMLSYVNKHFSVYVDVDETLTTYQTEFTKTKNKFDLYTNILYKIRRDVAKTNEIDGIDKILNEIAYYTTLIPVYESIVKGPVVDKKVLNSKLKQTLKSLDNENSYMSSDNVTTSIVTEEMKNSLNDALLYMKRTKRTLQDDLLERNITSYIYLDDSDVKVLKELGIV